MPDDPLSPRREVAVLRNVGAVLAGLVVMALVVLALQWVGTLMHPLPSGLNPADPAHRDAVLRHTASMPMVSWVLAFLSELVGAGAGAWTAGRLAGTRPRILAGFIVALALFASAVNWGVFPHPLWFMVGQVVAYPAILLGVWRTVAARQGTPQG